MRTVLLASEMSMVPQPTTQTLPRPRPTTAAWLVRPPVAVSMPSAAIMPVMSSGLVSGLTKRTGPCLASASARAAEK